MKYDGIYLDNDVYVVSNLSAYRKYEIAMSWDEGEFIGNQVIFAHQNAGYLSQNTDRVSGEDIHKLVLK